MVFHKESLKSFHILLAVWLKSQGEEIQFTTGLQGQLQYSQAAKKTHKINNWHSILIWLKLAALFNLDIIYLSLSYLYTNY